ncbi:MAG: phospholipase D-like domain-containing protein [Caldisericum exile]
MEKDKVNRSIKEKVLGKKAYIYNVIISALFIVLLFIYYRLIPRHFTSTPVVQSYNGTVNLFYTPDMGKAPVIDGIKNAKSSINIEVYTFSDTDVLQELVNAKKRGVKVRVILEENPYGGYSANKQTKDKLSYYGIETKWDNKAYNFTHSKFMIIDNRTGYIMTLNLTKSAFNKNREFGVIVNDQNIVQELTKIFEADWKRSPYNPSKDTALVLSPENSREKIEALLRSGTGEILIYAEEIQDPSIIDILKKRRAYGADVKIIIADPMNVQGNEVVISELKRYGVDIKYITSPFIHAKVIIVDRKYAFVGSENLSSNSLDNNREVGIILSNPEVVNKLREIFFWDFAK